jgi:hypothetical protein
MRSMPRWAVFVVGMYAGAAVVTLGFQTYVRLDHCLRREAMFTSGYAGCAVLRRVPSGQQSGQRRGWYTPLDCNAVLEGHGTRA